MNTTSWLAFQTLLEKCEPDKKSTFLSYLSDESKETLDDTTPSEQDPFSNPLSTTERISSVHYSWLITFLEPFAENDKLMILAALNDFQATKLKAHFKISAPLPSISPHANNFLIDAIYQWLISDQKSFVPLEFLPHHPLNVLLHLSKGEIQTLIDYLGLHDLAVEVKHIVKSDQIIKIQKVLSKAQQNFLKSLLKEKEPITFVRLNLDGWNGEEEKLKGILHHRGCNRLAKALFGCHPSLLWHICHTLDTGRTKILRKFFTDINNEQVQKALLKQVVELIPMVQKKHE